MWYEILGLLLIVGSIVAFIYTFMNKKIQRSENWSFYLMVWFFGIVIGLVTYTGQFFK